MKKLLTSLVLGLFLTVSASHANAAALEHWTYTYDVSLSAIASEFVYDQGDGSVSWLSGNKLSHLSVQPTSALNDFENTVIMFSSIVGENQAHIITSSHFLGQSVTQSDITNTTAIPTQLANLTVTTTASTPDGQNLLNLTYTIPLWSFYDASNDASYVYYSVDEIWAYGPSAVTYEGERIGLTGPALFFNNNHLEIMPDGSNMLYGWNFSSITQEPPSPEPTPEPATMLLTGLGLAGLGYVKRRRNKA